MCTSRVLPPAVGVAGVTVSANVSTSMEGSEGRKSVTGASPAFSLLSFDGHFLNM